MRRRPSSAMGDASRSNSSRSCRRPCDQQCARTSASPRKFPARGAGDGAGGGTALPGDRQHGRGGLGRGAAPADADAETTRHGILRTLLKTWRRAYEDASSASPGSRAPVIAHENVPAARSVAKAGAGESNRVEIILRDGRRVLVGTGVDLSALVMLVEGLDRR